MKAAAVVRCDPVTRLAASQACRVSALMVYVRCLRGPCRHGSCRAFMLRSMSSVWSLRTSSECLETISNRTLYSSRTPSSRVACEASKLKCGVFCDCCHHQVCLVHDIRRNLRVGLANSPPLSLSARKPVDAARTAAQHTSQGAFVAAAQQSSLSDSPCARRSMSAT